MFAKGYGRRVVGRASRWKFTRQTKTWRAVNCGTSVRKGLATYRANARPTAASQQLHCMVITMGRTSPPFRQRDLTRAYRAVEAAGGRVDRIEIDNGKIVLVPVRDGESSQANGELPTGDDKIAL